MKEVKCSYCGKIIKAFKIASARRQMLNHLIKEHSDKVDKKGYVLERGGEHA